MTNINVFAMGQANRGKEQMVFDWLKAAQLIKEAKPVIAGAGLAGDWDYTGGTIFENNAPVNKDDSYTYLSSDWATPELEMDGLRQDCYQMQSALPDYGAKTFWPEDALEVLNGGPNNE